MPEAFFYFNVKNSSYLCTVKPRHYSRIEGYIVYDRFLGIWLSRL